MVAGTEGGLPGANGVEILERGRTETQEMWRMCALTANDTTIEKLGGGVTNYREVGEEMLGDSGRKEGFSTDKLK